jgi:hypothetical protein
MEREAIIQCFECGQPIVQGEDFVRFKVPGEGVYQCFHRRFNAGDCWERRLKQRIEALIAFMGSNASVPG